MVLPLPEVRATLYHEAHMKNLMDAKIDAYIALNPKHWRGIPAMTREHLERTLVALYVQRQEAHERRWSDENQTASNAGKHITMN